MPAVTPNLRSAEDQRMASSAKHILSRSWGFSIPSRLECNVIAGPYPERWASVRSFRRHEREDRGDDPSERADEPKADRHLLLGPTDELEKPWELARRGDERDGQEREDREPTREAIHPVGEVDRVRHRDDGKQRQRNEEERADLYLADKRDVDARDAEVPLDVDRCGEPDDRLPYELVAATDAGAVANVHEVIDRAEHTDREQRPDGHDRLRDEEVSLVFRQRNEDQQPERARHAYEKRAAHRRDALLHIVGLRPFRPDVLTDPQSPQQTDVRRSEDQTEEKGREQHPEREDGQLDLHRTNEGIGDAIERE